jgi:hypothetical protein
MRMLAGNADRDRATDVLKAAYAEGRLTKDEYDYRVGRAVAARTVEELQQLTSDVPNGPSAVPPVFQSSSHPAVPQGQLTPVQPQPVLPYTPPRRHSPTATAALVCGIGAPVISLITVPVLWQVEAPYLFWVGAAPAVFLGHKARNDIARTRERGEGAATAGLVLGWLWTAVSMLLAVIFAASR